MAAGDDYDHAGRDKFALVGAHAKIDCHVCHTGAAATQKLAKDCAGCHRSEDPHGGKLQRRVRDLSRSEELAIRDRLRS